jgi:tellurite resistance protein TerC
MLVASVWKIPIGIALGVIAGILLASVIASLLQPGKKAK